MEYTGKCRLTVCQLVLITDVPKNPKKRQNCTTTHVSSLDTVEEQGGVVVPTFPLTTMPNSASESTFAFTTTTSALNRD